MFTNMSTNSTLDWRTVYNANGDSVVTRVKNQTDDCNSWYLLIWSLISEQIRRFT